MKIGQGISIRGTGSVLHVPWWKRRAWGLWLKALQLYAPIGRRITCPLGLHRWDPSAVYITSKVTGPLSIQAIRAGARCFRRCIFCDRREEKS